MKMIRNYGLILILLFMYLSGSSQEDVKGRKAVFIEYNGLGVQYSVNFDLMLSKPKCGAWAMRMGVGGLKLKATNSNGVKQIIDFFSVPVGIHYLVGKYTTFLEAGFGVTPIIANFGGTIDNPWITESGVAFAYFGNLSYRYQAFTKGIFIKGSWTPVFNLGGFDPGRLGLSIGYSFR